MALIGTAIVSLSSAIVGGAVAAYLSAIKARQRRIHHEVCDPLLTEIEPILHNDLNLSTKFDEPESVWNEVPPTLRRSFSEDARETIREYTNTRQNLVSATDEVSSLEEQIVDGLSNARMTDEGAEFIVDFDNPHGSPMNPGPKHNWDSLRRFILKSWPVIENSDSREEFIKNSLQELDINVELLDHSAGGWSNDLLRKFQKYPEIEYPAAVKQQHQIYKNLQEVSEEVEEIMEAETRKKIGISRQFSNGRIGTLIN